MKTDTTKTLNTRYKEIQWKSLFLGLNEFKGVSYTHKFGSTSVLGKTQQIIADFAVSNAIFTNTARYLDISSTSAADTNLSTGAWTLLLVGLDENWLPLIEPVVLNGLTKVTTKNKFIRQFRAIVYQGGNSNPITNANIGDIKIVNSGGTDLLLQVTAGEGQTNAGFFTTPANSYSFLMGYSMGAGRGRDVTMWLKAKHNNIANVPFVTKLKEKLYQNYITEKYSFARFLQIVKNSCPDADRVELLSEKQDLVLTGKADTINTEVSATFDILTFEKDTPSQL